MMYCDCSEFLHKQEAHHTLFFGKRKPVWHICPLVGIFVSPII